MRYRNAHEHILDLLAWLDLLLRQEIARGLVRGANDEEIEGLLDSAERRITYRVANSLAQGVRLPLIELKRCFSLTAFEIDILLACLAAELDRRYERIYGYLHDDMSRRRPSPGLLLKLHSSRDVERIAARSSFSPLAALRYYRLIEMIEDTATSPWLSCQMRIDERLVAFLLGDESVDSRLTPYLLPIQAIDRSKRFSYLHGARDASVGPLSSMAPARLGTTVLCMDMALLPEQESDFERLALLLFREGLLRNWAVCLVNIDQVLEAPRGTAYHRILRRCIRDLGGIVFASGERPWVWDLAGDHQSLTRFSGAR
jgi:hypothetical protein